MSTTTARKDRSLVAFERLAGFITHDQAALVANRDVEACEHAVSIIQTHYERTMAGSCCKPVIQGPDHYPLACIHLKALWDARSYLELARAGAPVEGAYPCKCNGTGVYCHGGAVVNGHYTGQRLVCYGCGGKGYMTEADKIRNHNYWRHYARV